VGQGATHWWPRLWGVFILARSSAPPLAASHHLLALMFAAYVVGLALLIVSRMG